MLQTEGTRAQVRTWGKNPRFRSLEYLIGSDGTPATWLPAARVRRGELEVRSELLGVGAFAEVGIFFQNCSTNEKQEQICIFVLLNNF